MILIRYAINLQKIAIITPQNLIKSEYLIENVDNKRLILILTLILNQK